MFGVSGLEGPGFRVHGPEEELVELSGVMSLSGGKGKLKVVSHSGSKRTSHSHEPT